MFMQRTAEDDFRTLQIANAMESAGATVISITFNGRAKYQDAINPHSRFIVWARVKSVAQINKIDKAIEKEFEKAKVQFHTSYPTDNK